MFVKTLASAFIGFVLVAFAPSPILAAGAPMSIPQLALYQGTDRKKILIEGAKREGQFTLYDSHTWFRTYVKAFEKKYPFIKVSEWRNDSKNLIRRAMRKVRASTST